MVMQSKEQTWWFGVRDFQSFGRIEQQSLLASHIISNGYQLDTTDLTVFSPCRNGEGNDEDWVQDNEPATLSKLAKGKGSTNSSFAFLYESYHVVFALDVSPSMFVPNSVPNSAGFLLFDRVRQKLRALLDEMVQSPYPKDSNFQGNLESLPLPKLYVSFIAESTQNYSKLLLHHVCVDAAGVKGLLRTLNSKLQQVKCEIAAKSMSAKPPNLRSQLVDPSDKGVSQQPAENVLVNLLENSLAVHCRNRDRACPLVVLMTDGVGELPPNDRYDYLLMRYCKLGVVCNVVQVAPETIADCAFLHVSDNEVLSYIARASGGILLDANTNNSMNGSKGVTFDSIAEITPSGFEVGSRKSTDNSKNPMSQSHQSILWQFVQVGSNDPGLTAVSQVVPNEPRVTSSLQSIEYTAIQHAFPWQQPPPPVPVLINVVMEYRTSAPLKALLLRRASEGFTLQEISTNEHRSILRLRLAQVWQPRVTINYIASVKRQGPAPQEPQSLNENGAHQVKNQTDIYQKTSKVVIQLRVLAPQEFVRAYYRVASIPENERYRVAHHSPFQLHRFLNCITEVDKVQAHLTSLGEEQAKFTDMPSSYGKSRANLNSQPENPVEYLKPVRRPHGKIVKGMENSFNTYVLFAKAFNLWKRWFTTTYFSLWTGRHMFIPSDAKRHDHPITRQMIKWADVALHSDPVGMYFLRFARQNSEDKPINYEQFVIAQISWETAFVATVNLACHGMPAPALVELTDQLKDQLIRVASGSPSLEKQSKNSKPSQVPSTKVSPVADANGGGSSNPTGQTCKHFATKNLPMLFGFSPTYGSALAVKRKEIEKERAAKLQRKQSERSLQQNVTPTPGTSTTASSSNRSQGILNSNSHRSGVNKSCLGHQLSAENLLAFHNSWKKEFWTPNQRCALRLAQLLVSERKSEGFVMIERPIQADGSNANQWKSDPMRISALSRHSNSNLNFPLTYHLAKPIPLHESHPDGPTTVWALQCIISIESNNCISTTITAEQNQVYLPSQLAEDVGGTLGHLQKLCTVVHDHYQHVDCTMVSAMVSFLGSLEIAKGHGRFYKNKKASELDLCLGATAANGKLTLEKLLAADDGKSSSGTASQPLLLGGKAMLPFAQKHNVYLATLSSASTVHTAELYCSLHDSLVTISGCKIPFSVPYDAESFNRVFGVNDETRSEQVDDDANSRLRDFILHGAYFATAIHGKTLLMVYLPPFKTQLEYIEKNRDNGSSKFEIHFYVLDRKVFQSSSKQQMEGIEHFLFGQTQNNTLDSDVAAKLASTDTNLKDEQGHVSRGSKSLQSSNRERDTRNSYSTLAQHYEKQVQKVQKAHQENFARQLYTILLESREDSSSLLNTQDVRMALKFCERIKVTFNATRLVELDSAVQSEIQCITSSALHDTLNADFDNQVSKLFFPVDGTDVYCMDSSKIEEVLSSFLENENIHSPPDSEDDDDIESAYSSTIQQLENSSKQQLNGSVSDSDVVSKGFISENESGIDDFDLYIDVSRTGLMTDGLTNPHSSRKQIQILNELVKNSSTIESVSDVIQSFKEPMFLKIEVIGSHHQRVQQEAAAAPPYSQESGPKFSQPVTLGQLKSTLQKVAIQTYKSEMQPWQSRASSSNVSASGEHTNGRKAENGEMRYSAEAGNDDNVEQENPGWVGELAFATGASTVKVFVVLSLYVLKPRPQGNIDESGSQQYFIQPWINEQPWIDDCKSFLRCQVHAVLSNSLLLLLLQSGEYTNEVLTHVHNSLRFRRPEEFMVQCDIQLNFVSVDQESSRDTFINQLKSGSFLTLLVSDSFEDSTYFISLPGNNFGNAQRIPFWSILTIYPENRVTVALHRPPWMTPETAKEHLESLEEGVLKTVHRANQIVLLISLNETRIASKLLLPELDEQEGDRKSVPARYASSSSLSSATGAMNSMAVSGLGRDKVGRRVTNNANRKLLEHMRRNEAPVEHGGAEGASQHEDDSQWTEWARKQEPGAFACDCIERLLFFVPLKEGSKFAIAQLRKEALNVFIVKNRSNVYVYKPDNGEVFFVQLRSAVPADFRSPHVEVCNGPDQLEEEAPGPREYRGDQAIVLEVYGINEAHQQFVQVVREVIKNNLTSLRFESLLSEVQRPNHALGLRDVDFLTRDKKVVKAFVVPPFVEDPLKLLLFFRQSLLEVLVRANFADKVHQSDLLGAETPGRPLHLGGYLEGGRLRFVSGYSGHGLLPALWPLYLEYREWEVPSRFEAERPTPARRNRVGSPVLVGPATESPRQLVEVDPHDMTFLYRSSIEKMTAEKKRHINALERGVGKGVALSSIALYATRRRDGLVAPVTTFVVREPEGPGVQEEANGLGAQEEANGLGAQEEANGLGAQEEDGEAADLEMVVVLCGRSANLEHLMKFHHIAFQQAVSDCLLEQELSQLSTSSSTGGLLLNRVVRSSEADSDQEFRSFESLPFKDVQVPGWDEGFVKHGIHEVVSGATRHAGRLISVQSAPEGFGLGPFKPIAADGEHEEAPYAEEPCDAVRLIQANTRGFVPRVHAAAENGDIPTPSQARFGGSADEMFGELVAPFFRIELSKASRDLAWENYVDRDTEIVCKGKDEYMIETAVQVPSASRHEQAENSESGMSRTSKPKSGEHASSTLRRLPPPTNEQLLRPYITINAQVLLGKGETVERGDKDTNTGDAGDPLKSSNTKSSTYQIHIPRQQFLAVMFSRTDAVLWHYNWRPEPISQLYDQIQRKIDWVRQRSEALWSVFFHKMALRRLRVLNSKSLPIGSYYGRSEAITKLDELLKSEQGTDEKSRVKQMLRGVDPDQKNPRTLSHSIHSSSSSLKSLGSLSSLASAMQSAKRAQGLPATRDFHRSRTNQLPRVHPLKDEECSTQRAVPSVSSQETDTANPDKQASLRVEKQVPVAKSPEVVPSDKTAPLPDEPVATPAKPVETLSATGTQGTKLSGPASSSHGKQALPVPPRSTQDKPATPTLARSTQGKPAVPTPARGAGGRRRVRDHSHIRNKMNLAYLGDSVHGDGDGSAYADVQLGRLGGRVATGPEPPRGSPAADTRQRGKARALSGVQHAPISPEVGQADPEPAAEEVPAPRHELHLPGLVPVEPVQNSRWRLAADPVQRQVKHFNACALQWVQRGRKRDELAAVTAKWALALDVADQREREVSATEVRLMLHAARLFHCGRARTLPVALVGKLCKLESGRFGHWASPGAAGRTAADLGAELLQHVVGAIERKHGVRRLAVAAGSGVDATYLGRRFEEHLMILEVRVRHGFVQCNTFLSDVESDSRAADKSRRESRDLNYFDIMGPVAYGAGRRSNCFPDLNNFTSQVDLHAQVYDFHVLVLHGAIAEEFYCLRQLQRTLANSSPPTAGVGGAKKGVVPPKGAKPTSVSSVSRLSKSSHDTDRKLQGEESTSVNVNKQKHSSEQQKGGVSGNELIQFAFDLCNANDAVPLAASHLAVSFETNIEVNEHCQVEELQELILYLQSQSSSDTLGLVWSGMQEKTDVPWFIGTSEVGYFEESIDQQKSLSSLNSRSPANPSAIVVGRVASSTFQMHRRVRIKMSCCLLLRPLSDSGTSMLSQVVQQEQVGQAIANIQYRLNELIGNAIRSHKYIPLWNAACGDQPTHSKLAGLVATFTKNDMAELKSKAHSSALVHIYPPLNDILRFKGVQWQNFVHHLKDTYKNHLVQVRESPEYLVSPISERRAIVVHICLDAAEPVFTVYSKQPPPFGRRDTEFLREFVQQVHFWLWLD